ncbi:hypothetical protein PRUPE_5G015800 [Prunus persica]|uniref:RING-type domain-containing protein n=1 Tax=Prunus persica TaxID=3760 RepID=M5WQ71_PRUPE|nr:E3 ubiquitin-protein ligase RLIM isoform X1 [Prunus persica]ONI05628.1 hypothetical protein PRUPE_5G015800 [Prunus persica]ONI05629.1 hypothetical protein PRUPE_5G015800 [Prunus persica]ONI05630.1 hypothetical protein PRUPE_5G015800 [Prunus persica]
MGSGGSKATASAFSSSTSSFGGNGRRRRSKSKFSRVLKSSCLGTTSRSHDSDNDDQVCDHQNKETRNNAPCATLNDTEPDHAKVECFRKVNVEQPDEIPCISSNVQLNEWGQASITDTASRAGSSSAQAAAPSLNPSSRFLSRFSFIPGNVSFRLSRATSLGSSNPLSPTSLTIPNNEDELHLHSRPARSFVNRDESQEASDLPQSQMNRSATHFYEETSDNIGLNTPGCGFSVNLQDNQTNSSRHDVGRNANGTIMGVGVNLCSPRNHNETGSNRTRPSERRPGAREPVERNVRFSRTLSVGRLRDRVLRRSSLSDLTFSSLQQEGEVRDTNQGDDTRTMAPEGNAVNFENGSGYPPSNMSSSLFSIQDYEVETSRPREARYHDLLEHRSNFLERRRRIRSQVRALQRLGSRFENVSGHERSCILSGQQRTGRCTCRTSSRDARPNDDNSARASISRIVMLAEALFEVLDEIHQQSVVLSSRPSVSSIGSVPAPTEVVESLPVKLFSKLQKHQYEEAAQCYICLVEYEEGDIMRVLPCHHEFHKTCIDKWLKEIHRVCPLCRRDICRSDVLPAEN